MLPVARPLLNLVEIAPVGIGGIVGFFVGPITHSGMGRFGRLYERTQTASGCASRPDCGRGFPRPPLPGRKHALTAAAAATQAFDKSRYRRVRLDREVRKRFARQHTDMSTGEAFDRHIWLN